MTVTLIAPADVELCLGVSYRMERTDEPDEKLRYRAVVVELTEEVAGLAAGDVLGYGRTRARARRRAVDKIANRRRGPLRSAYTVHGVMFGVGPNTDPSAPWAHGYLAQVVKVDQASPLGRLVAVGQVLARKSGAPAAADRAFAVLAMLADRARKDAQQQQLVAQGVQIAVDLAVAAGEWDDEALCRQVDPETFYPEGGNGGGNAKPAQAVCGRCSIKAECLARALDNREPYGVWGGETETSRRKMLRAGITGNTVRAAAGLPLVGVITAEVA